MRKRIQINQLQIGMFVEDVELSGPSTASRFNPVLVSSANELKRITASHVMSVVIDITKGSDVDRDVPPMAQDHQAGFNGWLLSVLSANEISQAKRAIGEIGPHLQQVLADARIRSSFANDAAGSAVERIMATTLENAGALIAVARLKEKDEVTFLHSLAVSALMVTFGRSLGHGENDVRLLGLGGLVHDLGKLRLPETILTKTGKLSAEEMELVRTHPERGYKMVAADGQVPAPVLDICRYHHEKYDGSGYPGQLPGKKIPYVARLAAICDVYEALTTIRPYKRAFSQAEAIKMMMSSPGHFDRKLLSAFVSKMVISGTIH